MGLVLVGWARLLQRRVGWLQYAGRNVCIVSACKPSNSGGASNSGGGSDAVWRWVAYVWHTLLAALSHRTDLDKVGDVAMLARRPSSMRRRVWRVTPLSNTDGEYECARWRDDTPVMCGHLFNAGAERTALGLGVGQGEECCIALEPIADVVLPFCTDLRVVPMHPQFTGVELRCGHRFSAVSLLWHWCTAAMICPICRAQYAPTVDGRRQEVRPCSVENFGSASWRLLRGLVCAHWDEVRRDQEEESVRFIAENVVDDSMQTVLGSADAYFLALSVQQADGNTMVRFLPLLRTSSNEQVLEENTLQYMVPRASIRRFSAAVSLFMAGGAAVAPGSDGTSTGTSTSTRMQSSVMLRIAYGREGESIMIPIAQVVDINLPVLTPCAALNVNTTADVDTTTAYANSAALQQPAPAPMAFDNGLEDAAAVLGVAYVNTTADAQTAHAARSSVPLEPLVSSGHAEDLAVLMQSEPEHEHEHEHEHHHHHHHHHHPVASGSTDAAAAAAAAAAVHTTQQQQALHPLVTQPALSPSPHVVSPGSPDAVLHALDPQRSSAMPQRSSAIYAPCVDATGEMAMEFFRFAGAGSNTLLSMRFSVDLLNVLHTASRYLSRDTLAFVEDTAPAFEAAPAL